MQTFYNYALQSHVYQVLTFYISIIHAETSQKGVKGHIQGYTLTQRSVHMTLLETQHQLMNGKQKCRSRNPHTCPHDFNG